MEWTLVAPFLELPPSCAALAALANRARPAVRCRTALPQKRRDWGGVTGPHQFGYNKGAHLRHFLLYLPLSAALAGTCTLF